jgi:hypothetical protein
MKPYGNHIEFIIGDFHSIQIVNMTLDMYIINKYDEEYNKENSKRKYGNYYPIETRRVNANDCVKLIIRLSIKEKLKKINESR